jgi:hypothetical protein
MEMPTFQKVLSFVFRDGNLADIALAGSLHEFLLNLHDKYGSIASFWWGNQLVISIASAELFQQQSGIFDRPRKSVHGNAWLHHLAKCRAQKILRPLPLLQMKAYSLDPHFHP